MFEIIHFSSLGRQLARAVIESDDDGPLTLAAVTHNDELRAMLDTMEPGDRLEMHKR